MQIRYLATRSDGDEMVGLTEMLPDRQITHSTRAAELATERLLEARGRTYGTLLTADAYYDGAYFRAEVIGKLPPGCLPGDPVAATPTKSLKYSDDQPRDEQGRWTSGGGGAAYGVEDAHLRQPPPTTVDEDRPIKRMVRGVPVTYPAGYEEVADRVQTTIENMPDWMSRDIKVIDIVQSEGNSFKAGGQRFKSGGDCVVEGKNMGTITLYNAEALAARPETAEWMLPHEAGHAALGRWNQAYVLEFGKVYAEHPKWIDPETGGFKHLFAEVGSRAYPIVGAQTEWDNWWRRGEDGITDYSKAWAKEGKDCETFAEFTQAYYERGPEGVREIAARSHAGNLGDAYLQIVGVMEARQ